MTKYYIAYGSNLNLKQMAHRCPTAKVVGTGELTGYQMMFISGVATIVPKEKSVVPIAVWEIDEYCERSLDLYEGFPHLYRKETIRTTVNNKSLEGMIYLKNAGTPMLPSSGYYQTIKEGYRDVGFDKAILEEAYSYTLHQIHGQPTPA